MKLLQYCIFFFSITLVFLSSYFFCSNCSRIVLQRLAALPCGLFCLVWWHCIFSVISPVWFQHFHFNITYFCFVLWVLAPAPVAYIWMGLTTVLYVFILLSMVLPYRSIKMYSQVKKIFAAILKVWNCFSGRLPVTLFHFLRCE